MSNPHAYKFGVYEVKFDRIHNRRCAHCQHTKAYYQKLHIHEHRFYTDYNYWYFCADPECGRPFYRDLRIEKKWTK